ncbi:hypothetical protein [Flavilitoribacter nigricans]|uniref:Uncharacterized protein n=1 Tax=Flavilitoribacter nigricans (strain ATCC 23147 / DSM 23189 / NBRC 102662 / NCIMB 1420 / SS-2) TaxID=1122177 RepID=A0A2D0N8T0_FLAN2|nr:hypothetical protein [Flavilitoribacter nigricans]PHN04887.1 hypothetical protein CRP01_20490 [Flavilitoribacter nigricans DSM 23189 = NBRC 102662]
MKNDYPRRRGGSSILNVLGFGFAVILMVGYLKNQGFDLIRSGSNERTEVFEARMYGSSESAKEKPTNIVVETDRSGDYDGRTYQNADAYRDRDTKSEPARKVSRMPRGNDWVNEFASVAVSQAVSRGVPAGLSLAVGLQHLEHGAVIISWSDFVEKVVDPLARAKQRASSDIRGSYFKYSANSDLWVEGLDALGKYKEKDLQAIMRQYALQAYDKQVRQAVISGTPVDDITAERAGYVAEEVTSHKREVERNRPRKEMVAIGGNAVDQVREKEEEAYYNEFVGREVAREIAKKKIQSGKYIGEEDMDQLIQETNQETESVVGNKLTFLGRKINRDHPEADEMLDITQKKNAAAREELYQQKLRENKLDSRSRRKHKD